MGLRDLYASIYELIKLIFFVFYMAHICGCSFYFVNSLEIEINNFY